MYSIQNDSPSTCVCSESFCLVQHVKLRLPIRRPNLPQLPTQIRGPTRHFPYDPVLRQSADTTQTHLNHVGITVSRGRFLAAAGRMSRVRHQRLVLAADHLVLEARAAGRCGRRGQVVAQLRRRHGRVEVPEHGQNRVGAHGLLARLLRILVQRQVIRFSVVCTARVNGQKNIYKANKSIRKIEKRFRATI